jgi:Protein of unknown function (DUF2587)
MTEPQGQRIVVIGQDGQPESDDATVTAGVRQFGGPSSRDRDEDIDPGDAIGEPAKVMRIGTMIKQLLEEVRSAPLDDASRERLKRTHAASLLELKSGLTPDLAEELDRLALPFSEDGTPSDAELRIAQAQLVGWLEGVFHGLQTALVAQQVAAKMQIEQMRRGLPPGHSSGQSAGHGSGTGQYL